MFAQDHSVQKNAVFFFICLSIEKTCMCGLRSTPQAKHVILVLQMNPDEGKLGTLDTVECSWTSVSADILISLVPLTAASWRHLRGSAGYAKHLLIRLHLLIQSWVVGNILNVGSEQSVGQFTSQHGWYDHTRAPQGCLKKKDIFLQVWTD